MDLDTFFNCLPWLLVFAVYFALVGWFLKLKIQIWWSDTEKERKERAEKKRKKKELKKQRKYWERIWASNY